MAQFDLESFSIPYELKEHRFLNLRVESAALRGNPLGDPSLRHNYVLIPLGEGSQWPVVFHLSGYFSTGYNCFQVKSLNENFIQKLDRLTFEKKIKPMVHIFVEATTYWGGSQFINSVGCGKYSDYLLRDLYPSVLKAVPVSSSPKKTYVVGGSSGGYGALSLISQKDSPFGVAFATAPDSFFEASLWPELLRAAPELLKYKKISNIKKMITAGEIQERKSFFNLANVIAMAHCYSPAKAFQKDFIDFPIDLYTGEIKSSLWKEWLKHDPIHFLKKRKKHLVGKNIHLDVGQYDNFNLQMGTRQIVKVLREAKVKHSYTEFPGNHFGLSERRLLFLQNL
jgi:hypothetical protein